MKKSLIIICIPIFFLVTKTHASFSATAVVTTGGVSLGVYEGGFLHEATRQIKNADDKSRTFIFTGASAGAINSFISIMEKCSLEQKRVEESIFWKMWVPLSFDKLYHDRNETLRATSILSREGFGPLFLDVENIWNQGLKKGCSAYLGITTTRSRNLNFEENHQLNFPRSVESFYFKIIGNGPGRLPTLKNFDLKDGSAQIFLNLPKNKEFKSIQKLLMASSSFPLAFEPESIEHCILKPKDKKRYCHQSNIRSDNFVDGGIFNNAPLDLAYNIANSLGIENKTQFVFFDPEIMDFPTIREKDFSNLEEGVIKGSLKFLNNFIKFSRAGQVSNFLARHPEVENNLMIIKSGLPLASAPLSGFMGFFETDFRRFDFYLGMANGRKIIEKEINKKTKISVNQRELSQLFVACYLAFLDDRTQDIKYCEKEILKRKEHNIGVLFNVSMDRLYSNCYKLKKNIKVENPICRLLTKGVLPVDINPNQAPGWKKKEEESLVEYSLRRLNTYGYEFKDLKLKKDNAGMAIVKIKKNIEKAVRLSARKQNTEDKFVLNSLTPPALNFLFYSPKPYEKYFLVSSKTIDMGFTKVFSRAKFNHLFTRYSFGLNINGLDVFERNSKEIGVAPYAGIIYEPKSWSSPTWQYRIGSQLGYQFVPKNSLKDNKCENKGNSFLTFPSCVGASAQVFLSSTLFQTFKLKLLQQWALRKDNTGKRPLYLSLLVGLSF